MGDAFLGDEHGAKKKAEAKPGSVMVHRDDAAAHPCEYQHERIVSSHVAKHALTPFVKEWR
jgi:hypothetical protein